jgi:hypothetical protein
LMCRSIAGHASGSELVPIGVSQAGRHRHAVVAPVNPEG